MKMRALGGPATQPAIPPRAESRTDLPAPRPAPVLLAAVAKRRADGAVLKVILPGPTSGRRVPYLSSTSDRHPIQSGWIATDGTVLGGMGLGQPDPPPGARLLAVTDKRGHVLMVRELPPKSRRRT